MSLKLNGDAFRWCFTLSLQRLHLGNYCGKFKV